MKKVLLASAFALLGGLSAHAADFGGAYVGGDVGYSTSDIGTDNATGFSGGVHAGYGVESDQWYFGGEIGGGFTNIDGDLATGTLEKNNYYTGAARLGYKVTDSVLAYGLVGLEGAQFDNGTSSERDWGYRYGAGVETFVTEKVSVRGQVNYIDWQGENGNPGAGEWRTEAGVSYHF